MKIKTISEYHRLRGLAEPEHPLLSVTNLATVPTKANLTAVIDFYSICLKRSSNIKLKYGQQDYDFDSGIMFFMSPNQVFTLYTDERETPTQSGWLLLIHPDLFWHTPLAKKIKQYDFFDYSVTEALFVSKKEEAILNRIIKDIQQEYHSSIDKYSKQIILSHVETLLNYAERFYNRQFITREKANHQILARLENLLTAYFNSDDLTSKGLPTVHYVAAELSLSTSYLGNLLRAITGQNTQQHIHKKLIEKAKEKLSITDLSISEIAYDLGFEHPQSFSKLFKAKTSQSPLDFRSSFN